MSSKPSSMRELHRLARERLGARAATLKTREELLAALDGAEALPAPAAAAPPMPTLPPSALVTQDFFVDPQGK